MDELGTVTVSFIACQHDVPKDIVCVASDSFKLALYQLYVISVS